MIDTSSEHNSDAFNKTIPVEWGGKRLDQALHQLWPEFSRERLKTLLQQGHITLNKMAAKPSQKVRQGDVVCLIIPPLQAAMPQPEAMALDILYEDSELLVINKAAGVVVHPGAGVKEGTLVNGLLAHCAGQLSGIGGVERPGIVHRLDKDTSGLMLVAKTDYAHQSLSAQLQARSIKRHYLAFVWGCPMPKAGRIETMIGRDPQHRLRMRVNTGQGKLAITDYTTLQQYSAGRAAKLECRLATGRTHQIRVHCQHLGHALIGDPLYRPRAPKNYMHDFAWFTRQALHAEQLHFTHPTTEKILSFQSPMPEDMQKLQLALQNML